MISILGKLCLYFRKDFFQTQSQQEYLVLTTNINNESSKLDDYQKSSKVTLSCSAYCENQGLGKSFN